LSIACGSPASAAPRFLVQLEQALRAKDHAAGVLTDSLGQLAGSTHRRAPTEVLREVVIAVPDQPGETVRLLTNLLDLEAWVIGMLYRYRWQVEVYQSQPIKMTWRPLRVLAATIIYLRGRVKREHIIDVDLLPRDDDFLDQALGDDLAFCKRESLEVLAQ
jgi:hypothetical protein